MSVTVMHEMGVVDAVRNGLAAVFGDVWPVPGAGCVRMALVPVTDGMGFEQFVCEGDELVHVGRCCGVLGRADCLGVARLEVQGDLLLLDGREPDVAEVEDLALAAGYDSGVALMRWLRVGEPRRMWVVCW